MADLRNASGEIGYFRIHDVGSGFGPPTDFIDVECVIKLRQEPTLAFGIQLRNDVNVHVHNGMLDLIRDAYFHNRHIDIEYWVDPGKNNGRIFRLLVH
jgi:hypothetical protein